MPKSKTHLSKKLLIVFAILFSLATFYFALVKTSSADVIDDLRATVEKKRKDLESINKKIESYKKKIEEQRTQASSLQGQIKAIDQDIGEVELEIEKTQVELDTTQAQIDEVNSQIDIKEKEIAHQKEVLGEFIRLLNDYDQVSTIEALFQYNSFSELVDQIRYVQTLQQKGQETLDKIQQIKIELENRQKILGDYKSDLDKLQSKQLSQNQALKEQKQGKAKILEETQEKEKVYQNLLEAAKKEYFAAQSSIKSLEAKIRAELEKQGVDLGHVGAMSWPVDPSLGISCEFRCSGYPYEAIIGPHSAIDIRAPQGTPIKAPADGVIGKNHDAGMGYSYIILIHGDNLTSVFGHVSGFAVPEGQKVKRGQVVGYSGGTPGSAGAGYLTTGPHLHWEVRLNGNPVNPRNYL